MELFGALTLFYVFILIITLVFSYLYDDDLWLKGILIISFVFTFGFFANHVYNQWQVDESIGADKDTIYLNGQSLEDYTIVGQETITSSSLYYVTPFDTIPEKKEGRYVASKFCFLYNNTDDKNVVAVTSGSDIISPYIYLLNSSSGIACGHFNPNLTYNGELMGVHCLDCSPVNTLNIPTVSGADELEIHITKTDLLTYTLEFEEPHLFFIQARIEPTEHIRKNFFLYMIMSGFLILIFIFRLIIVFIIKTKELVVE